ncbi:MAG: hypothetical protein M1416_01795 [Candidatus Pacearchaeota archaeon]|nr:hypothetical protein [Candidatus Pacearchaeota archaeon]
MSKKLNKILEVAEFNKELWNYIPEGVLPLLSKCVCEQDSDYTHYGIAQNKKGKFSFCYYDGKRGWRISKDDIGYLSVKNFKEGIRGYSTPEEIESLFVESMEEPIRKYELAEANIDEKVKKRMKMLEEELKD